MASAGGSLFGAPQTSTKTSGQFGAESMGSGTGPMSFGSASQFGGIGSGFMPGGDPYANIDIDFTKVKSVPFEQSRLKENLKKKKFRNKKMQKRQEYDHL